MSSHVLCFELFQDEETENLLSADFEIGHFIRERIIPRAVLYFTGEAIEDDEVIVVTQKPNNSS